MLEYKSIQAVKRVKKLVRVYNFDVPKYETYIANSIVVHNCENHEISQSVTVPVLYYSPEKLVEMAKKEQVRGIVFTFTEPVIHYEYIMDVYDAIKKFDLDLKIVLHSNGFVNNHILKDLDLAADAWNIDIKGGMQEYTEICGVDIAPVLATVEFLAASDTHLEISYLTLPQIHDNWEHHTVMRQWLSYLSRDIPVHLSRCYPAHKMRDINVQGNLRKIQSFFQEKMKYVYVERNS